MMLAIGVDNRGVPSQTFTIVVLVICGIAVAFIVVMLLVSAARKPDDDDPANRGEYWNGGGFYYNRDDKRVWVPRPRGGGWTINTAHPAGIIAFVLIIAFVIFAVVFSQVRNR